MKKPKDPIEEYLNNLNCFLIALFVWALFMLFIFVAIFFDIKENIERERYSQERLFLKSIVKEYEVDNILMADSFLLPISSVVYKKQEVRAIITGYSSTLDQTDSTPFVTASGERVREGIIACPSYCEFGDIIEIEGLGLFECQDVMNERYRDGHYYDIWFESRWLALKFGRQKREIIRY